MFRLKTILFAALLICSCQGTPAPLPTEKIDGMNLVAPPNPFDPIEFDTLKQLGVDWVSVIPYCFSRPGETNVWYNHKRQWWGEKMEGAAQTIKWAQERGLKVMVKPHIWVLNQGWAGDFLIVQRDSAQAWMNNYTKYVLECAKRADSLEVEIFCFATEFRKMTIAHPDMWEQLIDTIRQVYSGKLTYAANWDNYQNITFWDKLDFIGIDAYFPLETDSNPSAEQLIQAWQPWKSEMREFARSHQQSILFTEFGYRSIENAHLGHWIEEGSYDESIQSKAYEALFRTFDTEDWWMGGFAWKWYLEKINHRWERWSDGFTPQGKEAETVLKRWYED